MIKSLDKITLHLSIVSEMFGFYWKEKRWLSLPGLMIWSLLPLFLIIVLFIAVAMFWKII
ncbi:hypothetical protein [Candidatus Methylobacter oryzae]|uniref:Uncharacterized protein n=1 Tax=Candidatus Methylobacter oryzae TaxID=2497749 RepID=A0ABY3C660_9GAMM|nr:hypothetical protein [Candidatus Methylobacter oryzae]TRW90766.1 hypothetical protein EKO24_018385 [Candidatus Methylobacter oryzae]